MLTLGRLPSAELRERLADGLSLRTGPFMFRIRSREPRVQRGLASVYADFAPVPEAALHDFHIELDRVSGPRRWWRPQVNFWLDQLSPFKPLPHDHGFAMLEWGMNWCIAGHAHHYLLLHAAVLEHKGRCLILPGDPGAGKSTLCAALMLSGWRLLSDELAIIDPDDGSLLPLARPVGLKNASIDIIRSFDASAVLGEPAADTHKGTVAHLRPSSASVAAMAEPGRATQIVFPRWQAGSDTLLTPRSRGATFEHLTSHAFNYSLMGRQGFELMADLVDRCDCWDFRYSRLDEALRCFEALVE